jgi:hypothetical protein
VATEPGFTIEKPMECHRQVSSDLFGQPFKVRLGASTVRKSIAGDAIHSLPDHRGSTSKPEGFNGHCAFAPFRAEDFPAIAFLDVI